MTKVIVSHPGRQHSHELVYALQEGNMLLKYFTGFWYKPDKFPYNILKKLPRLEKELKKRYFEKIHPEFVAQNPFPEIKHRFVLKTKNRDLYIGKEFDRWVAKKLKNMDFDIFIGYELSSLKSFEYSKKNNKICIYDLPTVAYNFQIEVFEKYLKIPYEREVILKKKREIELADYFLVPSEVVKKSLIELNIPENKIFKIPYGTDLKVFSPKKEYKKGKKLKIIFVGNISFCKGIEILLKAMDELKNKIEFELNIVGGKGGAERILKRYEGICRYYSFLPHEELKRLYKENDIFIFPSFLEGFAQVVLEAMVSGLPVIVSDRAGSNDVVRNGIDGFIIPAGDVNALKEKILYFYNNIDKIEEMGKSAAEQARKYTWERYRENVRKVIKQIYNNYV